MMAPLPTQGRGLVPPAEAGVRSRFPPASLVASLRIGFIPAQGRRGDVRDSGAAEAPEPAGRAVKGGLFPPDRRPTRRACFGRSRRQGWSVHLSVSEPARTPVLKTPVAAWMPSGRRSRSGGDRIRATRERRDFRCEEGRDWIASRWPGGSRGSSVARVGASRSVGPLGDGGFASVAVVP